MSGGGGEVGIYGGVDGVVSVDNDVIGERLARLEGITELDVWDK